MTGRREAADSDAQWDVVIVGASFAGLAVARALAGAARVLLVDRQPIGAGQTSACAAPLALIEGFGAADSIEQVHGHGVMHLPGGWSHEFPLPFPYVTFDYETFCKAAYRTTDAAFLLAVATGIAEGTVLTSAGPRRARVIVDASGWRSVLTPMRNSKRASRRSMGIEVRLPGHLSGLHFWLGPQTARDGYLWDFPAGAHRRVGVLTYGATAGLKQELDSFIGDDSGRSDTHGGALPARLRPPVAGRVLRVGDAAGQCLPLTGEGIRPALLYGLAAGVQVRRFLAGEIAFDDALAGYRRQVEASRRQYTELAIAQVASTRMPDWLLRRACRLCTTGPLTFVVDRTHWAAAPMELAELLDSHQSACSALSSAAG